MAHLPPNPNRMSVEKIALRVIVYGTATLVVATCFFIAWLVFAHNLFPSFAYRLVVLALLILVILRVPAGIREVYKEVARRG